MTPHVITAPWVSHYLSQRCLIFFPWKGERSSKYISSLFLASVFKLSMAFSAFRLQPASPAVDFMTMTYKSSPVRRLSTASSILKPPTFILTTEWLWYWKSNTEQWQEFGKVCPTCRSDTREECVCVWACVCYKSSILPLQWQNFCSLVKYDLV